MQITDRSWRKSPSTLDSCHYKCVAFTILSYPGPDLLPTLQFTITNLHFTPRTSSLSKWNLLIPFTCIPMPRNLSPSTFSPPVSENDVYLTMQDQCFHLFFSSSSCSSTMGHCAVSHLPCFSLSLLSPSYSLLSLRLVPCASWSCSFKEVLPEASIFFLSRPSISSVCSQNHFVFVVILNLIYAYLYLCF